MEGILFIALVIWYFSSIKADKKKDKETNERIEREIQEQRKEAAKKWRHEHFGK